MILTELELIELKKYIKKYNFSKYLSNKTILITGSKGIVGGGIIKYILLLNELFSSNIQIIASTRNPYEKPSFIENTDQIEYCEFGKEDEYCFDKNIDFIVHSAAPTSNTFFKNNPVEAINVIIDGTRCMLELAKKHHSSMVYLSSEEVYGTPNFESPITEDYVGAIDSLNTRSCYPLGKKTAELLCKSYYEEYGLDVKIIRPTVILGLWQDYNSVKVEAEILRSILENKDLIMKSDGSTKKSVIYSLDAVTAVLIVMLKGKSGEAYNATNPLTFCSVKERAESAFLTFNQSVKIRFDVKADATKQGYLPKRYLKQDISKISSLGWVPLADMEYIYKIDMKRFEHYVRRT